MRRTDREKCVRDTITFLMNFDRHFSCGTFLVPMATNNHYSSNSYKSIEIVFSFGSLIVSSAAECALFDNEICMHIASEFDTTGDFFRIKLSPQESIILLFFNFSVPNYVHIPFKVYLYTHRDHLAQLFTEKPK